MTITIPHEHWRTENNAHLESFVPNWERKLRESIERQPDAALRFADWLSKLARGESGMPGVRLIFIEEPYLAWAENVTLAIETERKALREQIAYEVVNPDSED